MNRKVRLVLFSTILVVGFILLLTGSTVLTKPLLPGFPIGNFIAWCMLIAYSALIDSIVYSMRNTLNIFLKLILVLSVFWGFVSFLLAGNWEFVFMDNSKTVLWLGYTSIIILAPLIVLVARVFPRFFTKR